MRIVCPNCNSFKGFYKISDGRLKCSKCKKYFTPNKNLTKISRKVLKQIISEFLLEHSTNIILDRVDISKYKLLKVLTLLRTEMTKDVPDIFSGTVEVDETYLGGQWKNKRLSIKKKAEKQGKTSLKGNYINGLEGFWGYLKRKLSTKGGIRRKRLPLYLGEYVWRYNHRKLSFKEREKLLFKLITKYFWFE